MTHGALTWLCLVAFTLTSLVSPRRLVACTDHTGNTRIEWACFKDTAGACAAADDHEDEHHTQAPCDDRPLQSDDLTPAQVRSAPIASAPALSAPLPDLFLPHTFFSAARVSHPARPPDSAAQRRAVVRLI